jgi:hypothetical protein
MVVRLGEGSLMKQSDIVELIEAYKLFGCI